MKIVLRALGPSIKEQLKQLGLEHDGAKIEFIDDLADDVTQLHLMGILTDAECTRARTRIVKMLNLRETRITKTDPVVNQPSPCAK